MDEDLRAGSAEEVCSRSTSSLSMGRGPIGLLDGRGGLRADRREDVWSPQRSAAVLPATLWRRGGSASAGASRASDSSATQSKARNQTMRTTSASSASLSATRVVGDLVRSQPRSCSQRQASQAYARAAHSHSAASRQSARRMTGRPTSGSTITSGSDPIIRSRPPTARSARSGADGALASARRAITLARAASRLPGVALIALCKWLSPSALAEVAGGRPGPASRSFLGDSNPRPSGAWSPPKPLRQLRKRSARRTVHDLRGESRNAVLVVADRLRSRARGPQGALWSRPLLGETVPPEEAEELRIVFVALTRARRYCAVALPTDTEPQIIEGFKAAGFTLDPAADSAV